MYIDRWIYNNKKYQPDFFNELISKYFKYIDSPESEEGNEKVFCLDKINHLLELDLINTDEPPREKIIYNNKTFNFVRPLFNIFEDTTKKYYKLNDFPEKELECFPLMTREYQTPREKIMSSISYSKSNEFEIYIKKLFELIERFLNQDGTAKSNVRNRRIEILGFEYKPNFNINHKTVL
jgi:hypothetical protein